MGIECSTIISTEAFWLHSVNIRVMVIDDVTMSEQTALKRGIIKGYGRMLNKVKVE
jgi:hypothetical protein